MAYSFKLTFPICGHSNELFANTRQGIQDIANHLIENQKGLCNNCYHKYCTEHSTVPWYSTHKGGELNE